MRRHTRGVIGRGLLISIMAVLLMLVAAPAAHAQFPFPQGGQDQQQPPPQEQQPPQQQAPPPNSAEGFFLKVCQDAGFNSVKKIDNEPPTFSIKVNDKSGNESTIYISLFSEKDSKDNEIVNVLMMAKILEIPQNTQLPVQFLKKATELSAKVNGKIAFVNNKVYYSNTFWLLGLTPGTFEYEVIDTHFTKVELNKALAPFLFEQ